MIDTTLPEIAVEDVREGDLVDLESCPYLSDDPTAEFELATVVEVVRETSTIVFIGYDVGRSAGYEVGTRLRVMRNPANQQSLCTDRTI